MSANGCYASRDKFPCKDCQRWYPACQDHCDAYKQAKATNDARKAAEREKRQIVGAANEYTIKQAAKARRKKLPQR